MFSGKGAREEAAKGVARAVSLCRNDYELRKQASFRGFEILSWDQAEATVPDLFIRAAGTYTAHVNADNPLGIMRRVARARPRRRRRAERLPGLEKTLVDY